MGSIIFNFHLLIIIITIFCTRVNANEEGDYNPLDVSEPDEIDNVTVHKRTTFTLELILIAIISYWVLLIRKFNYWNSKGVKSNTPKLIIGNMGQLIIKKQSVGQFLQSLYNQFPNEKYVGLYEGMKPSLLLRDPKLITEILIKNFEEFKHRSMMITDDRILDNITFGNEQTWNYWRKHLSPIFTSSRLKSYLPLIQSSAKNLCNVLSKEGKGGDDVNIQNIIDQYTSQLSARCFLEMKHDTFNEPSWLMDIVNDIMTPTKQTVTLLSANRMLRGSAYYLQKLFNLELLSKNTKNFFIDIVKQCNFHDGLKSGGKTLLEKIADTKKNEEFLRKFDINDENLAAQVLLIFSGGFETSSKTTSFIIYELSRNQNIQDRLYDEISSILAKHGEFNYEALEEMKYLDMVFNEGLRKYPSVEFTVRRCQVNNFKIPETDVVLEKNTDVYISISGLHNDERYYCDPEKFNPERFTDESKLLIKSASYLPFGMGPRHCLGARFGKLSVKTGLVELLMKFKLKTPSVTEHQTLEIDPTRSITKTPKNGVWVKILPRLENKMNFP